MSAIFKREFKTFFTSPIGYFVLAVLFGFSGFYFFASNMYAGSADLSGVFGGLFTIVLLLVLPVLTMRLLSDDKRQRTDQALLTAPVSLTGIALGKFLAALLLFAIGISITLVFAVIIAFQVTPDWLVIVGNYVGLLLLGGMVIAIGLFIGFCLPAGLAHSPKMHKGYDLYSAAVPVGLTAFFVRALLYQALGGTLPGGASTDLGVSSWNVANVFCFGVFGLCIVGALVLGCRPKDYWRLLRDPGYSVDFSQKYGNAAFLMNVGIYGLFIVLYYNLVGATFNAVTFGCIFCMLACCCSGSHPGNVWPIMVGYVAASFLGKWFCVGEAYTQAINAQAIVVGLCFANGLSPISGRYGWPFGILAGMLHFTLVTSVPLLHGGFCLYNGGFTAAFVCMFFIPVFERFFRTKEERKLAKAERTANSQ